MAMNVIFIWRTREFTVSTIVVKGELRPKREKAIQNFFTNLDFPVAIKWEVNKLARLFAMATIYKEDVYDWN